MPIVLVESTQDALARVPEPSALLTELERKRAAGFVFPADAETFIAAHLLVRVCAGLALGVDPAELTLVQTCPTCDLPTHGRPSIKQAPELAVSLSHSRGHVAACAGTGPIGIDIESAARGTEMAPIDKVLTPGEAAIVKAAAQPGLAFLDFWVRKEALIKAGLATLDSLETVDLSADPTRWGGLHIAGWRDRSGVMAAIASPERYEPEFLRI